MRYPVSWHVVIIFTGDISWNSIRFQQDCYDFYQVVQKSFAWHLIYFYMFESFLWLISSVYFVSITVCIDHILLLNLSVITGLTTDLSSVCMRVHITLHTRLPFINDSLGLFCHYSLIISSLSLSLLLCLDWLMDRNKCCKHLKVRGCIVKPLPWVRAVVCSAGAR